MTKTDFLYVKVGDFVEFKDPKYRFLPGVFIVDKICDDHLIVVPEIRANCHYDCVYADYRDLIRLNVRQVIVDQLDLPWWWYIVYPADLLYVIRYGMISYFEDNQKKARRYWKYVKKNYKQYGKEESGTNDSEL